MAKDNTNTNWGLAYIEHVKEVYGKKKRAATLRIEYLMIKKLFLIIKK
ncbi:hypothetical protein TEPIDINF_000066 [Tepidibacillus infernus]